MNAARFYSLPATLTIDPPFTPIAMIQALVFDVDGTLADTENAHREAFNEAFNEARLPWHWDEALYGSLLRVSGGKERILHYWKMVDPEIRADPTIAARVDSLHASKTRLYEAKVHGGRLPLRPGIARLITEAGRRGRRLAIATTTTPANVDALLRTPFGPNWRKLFAAVGDAATAPRKKPDPMVYLQVLATLGLKAYDCLAFEDSENGLRAAAAAGLQTLVTPTAYTQNQSLGQALLILPHLGDPEQPLSQPIPGLRQPWVTLDALDAWFRGTEFEAA